MRLMSRRTWLRGGLALFASGCAEFAVRPPTPAAQLDRATLSGQAPGERFYAIIFASQSVPKLPARSHTWATVIRTVDRPEHSVPLEVHTISWLPATLQIRPLSLVVEPGVNIGLHETIAYAKDNHERISMWGPYECRASFFRRFLIQKEFVESGRIGYQCVDNMGEAARKGNGSSCIHAISDMDPDYGRGNYPLIWFGDAASEHIVNSFHEKKSLLNPEIEHDWLIEALGLNKYCIVRRHYQDRILDFPRLQPGRLLEPRARENVKNG